MTLDEMEAAFNSLEDQYLKFERIVNPRHARADLCAFLMLADMAPCDKDFVSAAEHDEIWFDADPETVAAKATPETIADLVRCGMRYDENYESFCMFV